MRLRWVSNSRSGKKGTSFQQCILMGTSTAYNTIDTANTKFIELYNDCGATSGDNTLLVLVGVENPCVLTLKYLV